MNLKQTNRIVRSFRDASAFERLHCNTRVNIHTSGRLP